MAAHLVRLTMAGRAENVQDLNHFSLLAFQDFIFAQKINNILSCLMFDETNVAYHLSVSLPLQIALSQITVLYNYSYYRKLMKMYHW